MESLLLNEVNSCFPHRITVSLQDVKNKRAALQSTTRQVAQSKFKVALALGLSLACSITAYCYRADFVTAIYRISTLVLCRLEENLDKWLRPIAYCDGPPTLFLSRKCYAWIDALKTQSAATVLDAVTLDLEKRESPCASIMRSGDRDLALFDARAALLESPQMSLDADGNVYTSACRISEFQPSQYYPGDVNCNSYRLRNYAIAGLSMVAIGVAIVLSLLKVKNLLPLPRNEEAARHSYQAALTNATTQLDAVRSTKQRLSTLSDSELQDVANVLLGFYPEQVVWKGIERHRNLLCGRLAILIACEQKQNNDLVVAACRNIKGLREPVSLARDLSAHTHGKELTNLRHDIARELLDQKAIASRYTNSAFENSGADFEQAQLRFRGLKEAFNNRGLFAPVQ